MDRRISRSSLPVQPFYGVGMSGPTYDRLHELVYAAECEPCVPR
jgi:hypothetical protein